MKENCKPIPIGMPIDIDKMHGHTTIILKDVKTGKEEVYEDDNYMTDAIRDYFANCGFLNYPNIDRANLVPLLLGGIMAFDDAISDGTEDTSIVHVPAGLNMIANGSVGVETTGDVLEMGTYITSESGWQDDGSYVQTYEYGTSKANGTIACVCLTGNSYAFVGEGNSLSLIRHSTRKSIIDLVGSMTAQTGIVGTPFNINLTDSSCYTFAIETRTDVETEEDYTTGVLRKYRLPISKINLKATMSAPYLLSETEIAIDADMIAYNNTGAFPVRYILRMQPDGQNLIIWNAHVARANEMPHWGDDFSQYVWTLTPSGTITKRSYSNTSGETLTGLQAAIFDGNYCFFVDAWGDGTYGADVVVDTSNIYVLNRTTGTIAKIANPHGIRYTNSSYDWRSYLSWAGWIYFRGTGDGRIITSGNYPFIVDAVTQKTYITNANTTHLGNLSSTSSPLILANGVDLYRDQTYIASINNLETPVVKTAEKSMKIIYRITFEEV